MQWRFEMLRSGSANTQSFSGPRPIENSPLCSERVSGATVFGQRSIDRVSVIRGRLLRDRLTKRVLSVQHSRAAPELKIQRNLGAQPLLKTARRVNFFLRMPINDGAAQAFRTATRYRQAQFSPRFVVSVINGAPRRLPR